VRAATPQVVYWRDRTLGTSVRTKAVKHQVDPRELERIVRRIVELFHPERIILFGSQAYGEPHEDSDVDLLILVDTDRRPISVAADIGAALDRPFPLDIIVRTPAEWRAALDRGNYFASEIEERGRSLYEAGHARVGGQG
jgi:uncharacterized protein